MILHQFLKIFLQVRARCKYFDAVERAKKMMLKNQENGYILHQYKGYRYYKENPSLMAWEAIEKILSDCNLI